MTSTWDISNITEIDYSVHYVIHLSRWQPLPLVT